MMADWEFNSVGQRGGEKAGETLISGRSFGFQTFGTKWLIVLRYIGTKEEQVYEGKMMWISNIQKYVRWVIYYLYDNVGKEREEKIVSE